MRNFAVRLFVNALALSAAAWLVPGIALTSDFGPLLLVALVFGLINALLKPLVLLLSIPFLILTLGLFAFVVNGALLLLTAWLTPHLEVSGLGAAILGSVVISLVTMLLGGLLQEGKKKR